MTLEPAPPASRTAEATSAASTPAPGHPVQPWYTRLPWVPLGSLAVAGALGWTPLGERLSTDLADTVMALAPPPLGLEQVLVVDLDEGSIQQLRGILGSWPYPRDAYVPVLDVLQAGGARVAAFNILFSDPRPGDEALAARLGGPMPVVLGVVGLRTTAEPGDGAASPAPRQALGGPVLQAAGAFEWPSLAWPTAALRVAAVGPGALGVMSAPLDGDERLRRLPVLHREGAVLLPALPVAAVLAETGHTLGYEPATQSFTAGPHRWPVQGDGSLPLPLPGRTQTVTTLRFGDVYRAATAPPGDPRAAALLAPARGRAVFIGSSASSGDNVPTARGQISGTELQALAYAALKNGTVMRQPGVLLSGALLLPALLPGALAARRGAPMLAPVLGLTLVMAALLFGAACAASALWHTSLPLGGPAVVLACGAALSVWAYLRWVRENQRTLALQRAVAEAANRAKSEFLTTVSHEIRTPINAMLGISELLAESPLNDEQRAHVNVLRHAGDNLSALINELLDLARIDAGRLELDLAPFALRPLLQEQFSVVCLSAVGKGLRLVCDVDDAVPEVVLGDRKRLGQVLLNLLSNAVKFTPQGQVTIGLRRDPEDPARLRFQVRDTGIGISPDRCDSIFEPFTQADNSIARNFGGSGLGLTITRRLVELMGGQIEVVSALGEGSIFAFTARLPQATLGATPPAAAPAQAPRRLSILLAEDQPANAYLMQAMLRSGEHRIELASDGEEAVRKWEQGRFDVLLMDLQMPVLDGLAATRRIRAAEARLGRSRTPVIAISAHAFEVDQRRSLQAGCDAHVNKPVVKAELLAALARHVPEPAGGSAAYAPQQPAPVADAAAVRTAAGGSEAALPAPLDRLSALPGFEIRAALHRMGGDPTAFVQALGLALPSLRDWHARHVINGQPYDHLVAHDLKGVGTMMGAQALADAAQALDTALRLGRAADAAEASAQVSRWLAPAFHALNQALGTTTAGPR